MANTFSRTTRSLLADGHLRSVVGMALAAALLVAWGAWFFLARVAVYSTSDATRLEVDRSVHAVEARVTGRVVATHLEIGLEVEEDAVLVELDDERVELALSEQRAELASFSRQLEALREEIATEERLVGERVAAASVAVAEAAARSREAKAKAQYAREKADRWHELRSGGVVSGVEGLEARAEADQSAAALEASRTEVRRRRQERRVDETSQRALLARLHREAAVLEGQIETARATIGRLEHEQELHLIRAPVAGRIGEVTDLHVGTVVEQGDRLGSIVPEGRVRAVAHFAPSEAIGRIRPRQRARLRLDGYPWTQYGSLLASVRSVATEPQAGRVRVELDLDPDQGTSIPLEHGLPGSAEVEVERITPATMVVRAAGRLVTARPAAAAASEEGAPGEASP